jgi:hypothetical protein
MLMFDLLGERRSHITGSNCTSVNYNVVEMLQASSHSLRASAQQTPSHTIALLSRQHSRMFSSIVLTIDGVVIFL